MVRQITQSLRTLRVHDQSTPVSIIHCGQPCEALVSEAARANATIHQVPAFIDVLQRLTPYWRELSDYRTLAKMAFIHLLPDADQLLFVDCDTYWFNSPSKLFDKYDSCDLYATAEVGSHAYPYHPYADGYEEGHAALAASVGSTFIPPMNTGVMLMRRPMAQYLEANMGLFLDYVARLKGYGSPLKMPVNNPWIADEVSIWILLGRSNMTWGHLDLADVALSNMCPPGNPNVLSHFCSAHEGWFFESHPRLD